MVTLPHNDDFQQLLTPRRVRPTLAASSVCRSSRQSLINCFAQGSGNLLDHSFSIFISFRFLAICRFTVSFAFVRFRVPAICPIAIYSGIQQISSCAVPLVTFASQSPLMPATPADISHVVQSASATMNSTLPRFLPVRSL